MPIDSDFSIDRATGNIRHVSGTTTYTVLQFHRYLQDKADDASAVGDDVLDITDSNPSDRSTDNVITLLGTYNIDDTAAQFLYDGSISQNNGNDIYAGLVVLGSVVSGTQIQIVQSGSVLTSFWGTVGSTALNPDATKNIITRFLVKTRSGGNDTDGQRFLVVARELGNTYDEFQVTAGLGNNVAALNTGPDLNNQTAAGTISGWTTITNTEGYQTFDADNNGSQEPFYSQWDPAARSKNDLYERSKWLTRRGSSSTIYGFTNGLLFRGITHSFAFNTKAGANFQQNENFSWGSGATAGVGRLLAASSLSASGTAWIQLLTGVAPTNGLTITGVTSTGTAVVNGSVTQQTLSKQFLGVSTGSAIIGGFGVGIKAAALGPSDLLTDLNGVTHTPPNLVTGSVNGLTVGDRVLVAPWNGSSVDSQGNPVPNTSQMTLNATLNGAAVTSIVMSSAIPSDTPATGVIRVVNNSGYRVRIPYSAWTGSTFTVTSTNFSGSGATAAANAGNGAYVAYIDKAAASATESFQSIYSSDRQLVVRVRDAASSPPIKTFVSAATLGSAGFSITAIRTADQ